ncbi:unnamed protein product [Chondrus crispus]|uniref:Quaternary ammonium compound-resistance protein SugE n=1 Tax=Chondrus crispus TaxID=2769 RepID=R7QVD3_CHOCR|nr:unnamed protein product [Chondrus crispus]CDF41416.1 unnamed protein product [Chondrus crispus]|eukprot:XP_005711710.1 unnamed protein product [Chondrus crispus]
MSWLILCLAGLFEVAWSTGLKSTEGFTKPLPTVAVVGAIAASMWLLASATKTLPVGTAYAVWVGIGATGATILGAVIFKEPLTLARMGFLTLLLISIVGLKMTGQQA